MKVWKNLLENTTNKIALKAGLGYIISNFLIKATAIITTPIFTRLISPEAFGIVNTYTSWLGIFTIIGTLDIYSCVQIARHDYSDDDMDSFLSSILTASSFSVVLLYLVVKILGSSIQNYIGLPPLLIDIMFIEILFTNAFTIMQTKQKAYFKYKEFIFFSLTISLLSPICAIILINLQNSDLFYGKIIGTAIPKVIISAIIFLYILKKGKTYIKLNYWKYGLTISVPLIAHHLSGNLLNHFDKIMINQYVGPTSTGLYSLAYSYTLILSVMWTSFNQAWTPWFYEKMKINDIGQIKIFVKPYIVSFSLIFIGMLFLGPEALRIFGPEQYWNGKWVIPPILLGLFYQFMYSLYVNIEFFHKKTRYIPIGTVAASFINIFLNILLIPIYGYTVAGYTTLIGYIFLFIFHYYISGKWVEEDILGKKFIFSSILLMSLITFLALTLYNFFLLRYLCLIVIIIVIIAKYYFQVMMFMKNIRR